MLSNEQLEQLMLDKLKQQYKEVNFIAAFLYESGYENTELYTHVNTAATRLQCAIRELTP
jgi:hypothetical protein